jgi:xanthine dehydrogenase accessory factor
MSRRVAERATELRGARVPFVQATVVRAQEPASAHPGDTAIVLADGTIEGFVGGACARSSTRTAALDTLRTGRAILLRVLPEGEAFPDAPGAEVVVNPCLSGGALEIFLQPMVPPPVVAVVGDTPVADAVVRLAEFLGYASARSVSGDAAAVVVAGQGDHEVDALRAALDAGVDHIALVASKRRGAAVLEGLGLPAADRARIRTPAGLAIGARTPEEVALAIMAELVAAVRAGLTAPGERVPDRSVTAVDPVCGMTVTVLPDTPHLVVDGRSHWFCGSGCRDALATRG